MKQNNQQQFDTFWSPLGGFWRCALVCLVVLGGCVSPMREPEQRTKSLESPVYGTTAARKAREPRVSQLPRNIHDQIHPVDKLPELQTQAAKASYNEVLSKDVIRGASESISADEPMTIDQVMNYTLDHHPRLKARSAEIDVARGALIGAGLLINPEIVIQSSSPTGSDQADSALNSRMMFEIQTAHKRQRAQEVAQVGIRRACYALGLETQNVLLEAASAALEVQYLQELVEVQQHIADLAIVAAKVQQNKAESGVVTEVQSLVSQVDAADVQFDRLKTQAQLEAARLRLSRAIGMLPPQPLSVAGKMVVEPTGNLPLDDLLALAYEVRPELGRARTAVAESERQLALDHAKAVPNFKLGPRFGDNLSGAGDNIGARVQFDVPLFDRNQGDIASTGARIQANLALLRDTELTTLSDVAAAYRQLAPLEDGLNYYGTSILPLAEQTEAAIQSVQQVELIDPFLLTTQLRRLASMRINEVSMRYTHNQIRMRLELYLGRRLDEIGMQQASAAGAVPAEPQRILSKPAVPAPRATAPPAAAPRGVNRPKPVAPRKSVKPLPNDPTGMPADEPIEPALDNPATRPLDDPFEGDAIPEALE